MGAVAWSLRSGKLVGVELHDPAYEKTWAAAAGGDAVIGMGSPAGKRTVGLLWRNGVLTPLAATGDVSLFATDGTRVAVAGSVQGRAMLWRSPEATPIDLTPDSLAMSEVQALDGELQIGVVWKGWCPRAAGPLQSSFE
jgi:hypothetical protein